MDKDEVGAMSPSLMLIYFLTSFAAALLPTSSPKKNQQYLYFPSCHLPNAPYLSPRPPVVGATATIPLTFPISLLISPLPWPQMVTLSLFSNVTFITYHHPPNLALTLFASYHHLPPQSAPFWGLFSKRVTTYSCLTPPSKIYSPPPTITFCHPPTSIKSSTERISIPGPHVLSLAHTLTRDLAVKPVLY